MSFPLRQLVSEALTVPRASAKRLFALDLPRPVLVEAAFLCSVLAALVASGTSLIAVGLGTVQQSTMGLSPLAVAALFLGQMIFTTLAIHGVGRLFGGMGDLDGAIKLSVFLSFVQLGWSVVANVTLFVFQPLYLLLLAAAMLWTVWAYCHFIAQLHGFASWWRVMGVAFGLIFALSLVFALVAGPGQAISG